MKPESTADGLPPQGRRLLRLLLEVMKDARFKLGDPATYIGYKECCERLGLVKQDMDVHWGRYLQQNGLNDLNEWTMRHGLPAISGLIVNVTGDRAWYPGGEYFTSHRRLDPDFDWWEKQVAKAAAFQWKKHI
jgi:hypothetical protein